jgi:hypothetical protein
MFDNLGIKVEGQTTLNLIVISNYVNLLFAFYIFMHDCLMEKRKVQNVKINVEIK